MNKTICTQVPKLDNISYCVRECTISKLHEYDIKKLTESGFTRVFYMYGSGSYEGAGCAVGLNSNGKRYTSDIGHCSCYGPVEYFNRGLKPFDTIEEALKNSEFTEQQRDRIIKKRK